MNGLAFPSRSFVVLGACLVAAACGADGATTNGPTATGGAGGGAPAGGAPGGGAAGESIASTGGEHGGPGGAEAAGGTDGGTAPGGDGGAATLDGGATTLDGAAAIDGTLADSGPGGPATRAPGFGAYAGSACTCSADGGGPTRIEAFGAWAGATVAFGEDFSSTDSWTNWAMPGWNLSGWKAWKAAKPERRLIMSPSMGVTTDMVAGARGDYDAHWKEYGQRLVDAGLDDTIFRIAHEFNGTWYWYTPAGREDQFVSYWRHAVDALRSVPGQHFEFFFNPSVGVLYQSGKAFYAEAAYPGDDYVDYVGPDVYDTDYGTYPADTTTPVTKEMRDAVWNALRTGPRGLDFYATFAQEHGKRVGIGEWGVWERGSHHGGGDDPDFVQRMHDWIFSHDVAFHVYFDTHAQDGDHRLTDPTQFPESAARFQELF